MEPLTVIAKHMAGICDVAELCVCALTNGGFLDDLWTLQKFDYNPPHSALLTVRRYLSHFNTPVTCMPLSVAPQCFLLLSITRSALWHWDSNTGDEKYLELGCKSSGWRLGSYLCSKDVWGFFCFFFKHGFVLALVNLTESLCLSLRWCSV